jgi:glycosyltransferase involved in cell wall biosynthesis
MAHAGVDVSVLTTDPSRQLLSEESAEGVKIKRVPAWPQQRDYYFAPALYGAIVRGGWHVVHVQSYHTLVAPLAMLAAWRAHLPYVVTFHGGGHSSRVRHALRRAHWSLLRPLLARAARLVAIAPFEVGLFGRALHLPTEQFALIPNGADLPAIKPSQRAVDGTLIASVGRLERYKGHQRVIAALPHILKQQPDARLWIAGTGPYEAELKRLARACGVEARVEIRAIPIEDRARMAAELARAAHPIALLEALALGVPALVADTSGLRDLARGAWARAISLHSTAEEVATAVVHQLREPRVPEREDLPTWDDCAASLIDLYLDVTGKN